MNRNDQHQQLARTAAPSMESAPTPTSTTPTDHIREPRKDMFVMGSAVGATVLLFLTALLILTVVWLIYSTKPPVETKFVDPNKLQAIFLNSGQAYFGNIQAMNRDFVVVTNVFYLQTAASQGKSATAANSQVSLVKLGCELHMPYDRMIISRPQVTFWENLQDDGQVAKAVIQFNKQNPNGQKCVDQSQAPNGSVQGNSSTKQ